MRFFLAAWPTPEVSAALERLPRPALTGVRWTSSEQWHVTLRFLGELASPDEILEALDAAADRRPGPAAGQLGGSRPHLLGRDAVVYPVAGLEEVAAWVGSATAGFGRPPDHGFRGHLTVGRARSGRMPGELEALALPVVEWPVGDVRVVASRLGADGSRYETVASVELG
jgi:2'-5' RNA ligase